MISQHVIYHLSESLTPLRITATRRWISRSICVEFRFAGFDGKGSFDGTSGGCLNRVCGSRSGTSQLHRSPSNRSRMCYQGYVGDDVTIGEQVQSGIWCRSSTRVRSAIMTALVASERIGGGSSSGFPVTTGQPQNRAIARDFQGATPLAMTHSKQVSISRIRADDRTRRRSN